MMSEISYREKQERYKSLVREAWEKHQQGDRSQMANLLELSLEYTSYLRAETVSDWINQFVKLTKKGGDQFDLDLLSGLPEWNQVLDLIFPSKVNFILEEGYYKYNFSGGRASKSLDDGLLKILFAGEIKEGGKALEILDLFVDTYSKCHQIHLTFIYTQITGSNSFVESAKNKINKFHEAIQIKEEVNSRLDRYLNSSFDIILNPDNWDYGRLQSNETQLLPVVVTQVKSFFDVIKAISLNFHSNIIPYFVLTKPGETSNGYYKRSLSLTSGFWENSANMLLFSHHGNGYGVSDKIIYLPKETQHLLLFIKWLKAETIICASNYSNALPLLSVREKYDFSLVYEVRGLWFESYAAKMLAKNQSYDLEKDKFYVNERNGELSLMQAVDKIVVICEEVKQYLIANGVKNRLIHIGGNGFHVHQVKPHQKLRDAKSFVVGYFGTITYYEGLNLLVKAVKELRLLGLSIKLLLIGKNNIKEKEILNLNQSFIEYEQSKDNIERDFDRVDLFVIPRLPYTVSNTVEPLKPFELMFRRAPLLMADSPPLKRIAENGKGCCLFEAGNLAKLKEKIQDIYLDGYPEEKKKCGYELIAKSKSWKEVTKNYLGFIGGSKRKSIYFLYSDKWRISYQISGAAVNVINEMVILSEEYDVYYNDVYINDLISDGVFDEDSFMRRFGEIIKHEKPIMSKYIAKVLLPSRQYYACFYRSSNKPEQIKFFQEELSEPKIYSHNYVSEIWENYIVGFQTETACKMALTMKLRKLGDDGTLNYENIDIVPKRTFIRYQGIVSKLLSAEKISQISKSKTLKNKLKSEFLIGVIGTIYDQNYPDSLLEIVRGLRKRYPSKNIKIVIYSGNILKELPKENWIYVSRYKKTEQNRALLELDIIVNTWKAKPQIFSGSNKNLDAISLGIPLIAAKTPSYVEQLGEEYPLFYDFTEATTRFPSSIERQIWHHIESCFDDEYKERVQKYLLQRRLWRSHNVMRSLYKAQLEQLHQKKILIVVENFNVGGVQKYSRQIIECFSDFRVTIATSTTDDRAIEWVASMCCRVNIVLTQDFNIPLDDYDYAFLNSHPRDFQVLQELTIRLSKTKCKVYPIVHTDVHIFTQEVSHLLDYYSGIITVATKVTEKISTNKGISLRDKTHVITPVLNGGRSINSVPKTKRSKKIGYFGRMVRIKGVNFLVYAFAKLLREESIDYELHLYGPVAQESLKREIQATIKSLGGNSIFLHDEIIGAEERSRILCELDAVVYTTTMDGLPYTFLEAMELGTPILSTDVGGITNLIEDNVNGRIFRFNGLYIEDLYHKDPYNELAQIMSRQKDSYYLEFKRVLLDFVTNDEKFFAMSRNAITTVRRKFRNFNMYKSLMDIIYLD